VEETRECFLVCLCHCMLILFGYTDGVMNGAATEEQVDEVVYQ
jgi:hypothetical protein